MESTNFSVWENSVVIALRDFQWSRYNLRVYIPDVYVPLAGKVEANSADSILSLKNRLYIFEIKGQVANIKSEWLRMRHGNYAPKPVHIKLMNLARDVLDGTGSLQEKEQLMWSLQCHYFAYWAEKNSTSRDDPFDRLRIAPYIFATLQYMLRSNDSSVFTRSGFKSKEHCNSIFEKLCFNYQIETLSKARTEEIRIIHAYTNDVRLNAKNKVFAIGLNGLAFENYLTFLCGDAEKDRMHAVVLSPTDGYFRYVRKFSDLLALLPKPAPQPISDHTLRGRGPAGV